jgi:hypothetical protein
MKHMRTPLLNLRTGSLLALSGLLVACVVPPPQRTAVQAPPPVPPPIMVYPARGQTPDQVERDRYDCHVWAVQQSGYDPSRPGLPPGGRVIVQPANPPGTGTAVGAIAGAILGDANAQAQANAEQARLDRNAAIYSQGAVNYRRAINACLDARGYTTA